jgi:hypothetical protein
MLEGAGGIEHFATREDLKRAYNTLFTQLKNVTEFLVAKGGEDAMIAKKPLGGWSCASCSHNLDKLMGKIHGFKPFASPTSKDE